MPAGPALDSDPLLRRLDLVLTVDLFRRANSKTCRKRSNGSPREPGSGTRSACKLAIYLIITSPDFAVQR